MRFRHAAMRVGWEMAILVGARIAGSRSSRAPEPSGDLGMLGSLSVFPMEVAGCLSMGEVIEVWAQ